MTRREEHLGADEQHGAVLGAGEEGQVVDTESVRLSWFQTNAPDHAVELAAFTICMDEKTATASEENIKEKDVGVDRSSGRFDSPRSELFSNSCERPVLKLAPSVLKEAYGSDRGHYTLKAKQSTTIFFPGGRPWYLPMAEKIFPSYLKFNLYKQVLLQRFSGGRSRFCVMSIIYSL